ncbi:MAG TPA: hypothetical protein VGN26_09350 [Armatimonadota bacterium]
MPTLTFSAARTGSAGRLEFANADLQCGTNRRGTWLLWGRWAS